MEELVTCEGTVHSIIFQNAENGYTVLRLLTEEGEVITVVGCIPCVAPGEHLAVSGVPETHPQHGEQLRAVELERSLPEDEEEIFSYLSSGICKGVGPATARRIVERFGAETLDVLEREPERLTTLKGVTARKAQEIAESFRRHMGLRRLMAFLAQFQLPPVLAMELRRQYGDAALEKVRENPYLLSGEACGVEFSVTDGIAMGMGLAADSDQRLQAAVTFELSHNENNGHVFLPRNKLISATTQLLDSGAELVEQALDSLIERGAVVQEQVANVEACYLRRLWEAECSACIRLAGLLAADTDRSAQAGRAVDELEAQQGITYAPLQRQAVELAARTGVLVLTGGPGTGKTTTVRGIVALFRRMGLEIILAAPTGRAAKRMSELTGMEAQTVHRMLGMSWNDVTHQVTFQKTEKEPLEADAVIVDEMSMVDLALFSALLRALRPGTRLVLVGDADQLPSVGAGNVFSDLIRSGRVETIRREMTESGVIVLAGECRSVLIQGQRVELCGVDDPKCGGSMWSDQLSAAAKAADPDCLAVLLSHRPERVEDYLAYDFDLVLSGHAHGGQWRLPGLVNGLLAPDQGFFPAYAGGLYRLDENTDLVVSRGLARESTRVPRIFNPPELVIIDVTPAE